MKLGKQKKQYYWILSHHDEPTLRGPLSDVAADALYEELAKDDNMFVVMIGVDRPADVYLARY
jgi:hypothetical protein